MNASKHRTTTDDLRDAIGKEILDSLCQGFQSCQKVYFIVDTPDKDAFFLENYLLKQIRGRLGAPFVVDFADIGSGTTLVQDLLSMIFLRSEFPQTLLNKKNEETPMKVFQVFYRKPDRSLSEIAQRFLECKRLNDRQKKKIGLDFDLSGLRNAVEFFKQCVNSYVQSFKRMAVFYFRNPKLEKDALRSQATIGFFKRLQKEIPCAFVLKVQKDSEYTLLYVEDFCGVIRLPALDSMRLNDLVSRICKSSPSTTNLKFNEEGLTEFCGAMIHIHGQTVSASALAKALLDLGGQARLSNSKHISAETVRKLFSVDTVKMTPPKPRQPRIGLSPYFANEVERLTRQCEIFGLDPHYNLPWSFKKVMGYIFSGSLKYCHDDDTFETLRYIGHQYWLDLNSALRSMGYRYVGSGKWVFSPPRG